MRYSEEGMLAKRKSMRSMRRKYRREMNCVLCDAPFVARTPIRKYCDNCSLKVSHKKKDNYKRPPSKVNRWNTAREKAITRDKGTCQLCGRYVGSSIDVHHKDECGYRTSTTPNHELDNLICLCHGCHMALTTALSLRNKCRNKTPLLRELLRL